MATHKEKAEDLIKNFTDELISQIENNNAPWQVPWSPTKHDFTLPVNKDGTLYQGRNMMLLLSSAIKNGYTDDRWYTFNAAKELGAAVKKGEKASQIVRWQYTEERFKLDENGKKIIGEDGKPVKEVYKLPFPKGPFIHHVFNADQIQGLAPKEPPKRLEMWERHKMAENIIKNAQNDGVDIVHRAIDRAYYDPAKDQIVMPERHQFATADLYYATLLHEIGHATGHEKRLNRFGGSFNSEDYAKEELRAEISSMMIGQTLQIGHDTTQHQSYLKSWVKIVKEDPNAIFEAVKDAEKIKDYVLGLNKELDMEKTQDKQKNLEHGTLPLERDYIYAPYEDKDKVKALGAKYDPDAKMWYIPNGIDASKFKAWEKPPMADHQNGEREFREFLEKLGASVPSGHPITDGRWYRLHIDGDKSNSKNAVYIATEENGVLTGHFHNFKTGESEHFYSKQTAHEFKSPQELQKIQKDREEKELAQAAIYANTAQSAQKILQSAILANHHAYLEQKGVQAHGLYIVPDPNDVQQDGNIKIAENWQQAKQMREYYKANEQSVSVLTKGDLIIPAYNANGELSTLQTISQNGFKAYLKDGQKTGAFLTLGSLQDGKPFAIAEGYATAATIYEQLKIPTVVAFDSGNLKPVAVSLHEKMPNSTIYFAADNDHQTAKDRAENGFTTHLNPGIDKASEAAKAVGGFVLAPKFEEHDKGSDWNDLYKTKGLIELKDQFRSLVVDIQAKKSDLVIHKVDFKDKDLSRIQDIVMGRAFKNPDDLIDSYTTDSRTFDGRYIASDMMKEVFVEYRQSPASRNKYNNAVHNTAASLAAEHFKRMLESPKLPGRDTIVFLTGSPGAGKTTSVMNNQGLKDHIGIVFEGQLANAHQNPATIQKIQMALDHGYKVEITAVNPLPEQALENTFKRYYDPNDGRGAPISTMARIQGNTYEALKFIHEKFGDQVQLNIVDKPYGNKHTINYTGWQHLDVLKSQGNEQEIRQRLEKHLSHQYTQGKIDYECFKQSAGSYEQAKHILGAEMVGRSSQSERTHGSGRGVSQASGSQSHLEHRSITREVREDGTLTSQKSQPAASASNAFRSPRQPIKSTEELAEPGKTYTGKIVSVNENTVLQKSDTGKLIVHQAKNLPGILEQDTGSRMQIRYSALGRGDIAAKANDLDIAKQKEQDRLKAKSSFDFDKN